MTFARVLQFAAACGITFTRLRIGVPNLAQFASQVSAGLSNVKMWTLSALSFALDSDSTKTTDELLVLAPRLNEPVTKNAKRGRKK